VASDNSICPRAYLIVSDYLVPYSIAYVLVTLKIYSMYVYIDYIGYIVLYIKCRFTFPYRGTNGKHPRYYRTYSMLLPIYTVVSAVKVICKYFGGILDVIPISVYSF
jgi:hypothetical protein